MDKFKNEWNGRTEQWDAMRLEAENLFGTVLLAALALVWVRDTLLIPCSSSNVTLCFNCTP